MTAIERFDGCRPDGGDLCAVMARQVAGYVVKMKPLVIGRFQGLRFSRQRVGSTCRRADSAGGRAAGRLVAGADAHRGGKCLPAARPALASLPISTSVPPRARRGSSARRFQTGRSPERFERAARRAQARSIHSPASASRLYANCSKANPARSRADASIASASPVRACHSGSCAHGRAAGCGVVGRLVRARLPAVFIRRNLWFAKWLTAHTRQKTRVPENTGLRADLVANQGTSGLFGNFLINQ
ncbi:hypothetical protein ABZO35_14185 [Burkholderia pseudomallei]|uniref:hypothetical protein n=1 Tax=Burkholderia pseudomallei TaxID=28450 RepID=UPI0013E9482F|nr:hypothetical protein [Burkholderia pseudomallei]